MTDPEPPEDPLAALRERIERTQEAVDRLAAETAKAQTANGASTGAPPTEDAAAEAQALTALLQTVRGLVPEDLWRQLAEVIRQLLLLLRGILDWWIERIAPVDAPGGPVVQDIPVD